MLRPNLFRRLFPVREVFVAVPIGFEKASSKPDADPRFLREMAESMKKCPVVYENMNAMLKQRAGFLQTSPPVNSQVARDGDRWMKEAAAIESALLRKLLLGPASCTAALNAMAEKKKQTESDDHQNWSIEGVES